MPKIPNVRALMDSQHVKLYERLLKFERQYVCTIFWSFLDEITSENSVLVVSEILRLFVNILTPDDKYSLSVKTSVSRYQFKYSSIRLKKNISKIFSAFPETTWNLEYFEKKHGLQRWLVSEIIDCKKQGYLSASNTMSQNTYGQSTC